MLTMVATPDPRLRCTACGSDGMVVAYRAPVYVFVTAGRAARVVVADEESEFARRVWCRRCGEILEHTGEPDLGTWPAWEVGW